MTTRAAGRHCALQRVLGAEDIFLEFALTDPHSYVIVATATSARVQQLPGRSALREQIAALLQGIRNAEDIADGSERLRGAFGVCA